MNSKFTREEKQKFKLRKHIKGHLFTCFGIVMMLIGGFMVLLESNSGLGTVMMGFVLIEAGGFSAIMGVVRIFTK